MPIRRAPLHWAEQSFVIIKLSMLSIDFQNQNGHKKWPVLSSSRIVIKRILLCFPQGKIGKKGFLTTTLYIVTTPTNIYMALYKYRKKLQRIAAVIE